MKKPFFAFLMAAALLPFAASPVFAQTPPDGDGFGPPPQVRAQMEQLRTTSKTNAFNALSQDHRNRINAIISQFNAGTLDRRDAVTQIDAILSPSESQAVLAEGKKMRESMRAIFQANAPAGGNNGGERMGPPGGGQFGARNGQQGQHHGPDAGRTLLMLGANRPQRPPSGQPQQP
ncbi:MAG TPA: hypothetical protein VFL13_09915 [Candidatus Baltobacteraceae bacterium]|nr:hypothetical protein [Candidatus Baltobacteraceae bacterium]